jgi:hypothetical protein
LQPGDDLLHHAFHRPPVGELVRRLRRSPSRRPSATGFSLLPGHRTRPFQAVRLPCGHFSHTPGSRFGQVPPGHPSPPACPRQPGRSGMSGRIRLTHGDGPARRGPQPAGSPVRPFTTQG